MGFVSDSSTPVAIRLHTRRGESVSSDEGGGQNRVGVSAADTPADEAARNQPDGARPPEEGHEAVRDEGAEAGRELLLPHGGEAGACPRDGFLPRAA